MSDMESHRWAHRPDPDPDATVVNPFSTPAIAKRYAFARPNLHHHVTPILLRRVLPQRRRALDLGYGTGLSTAALTGFANTVVGADASEDMLAARTDDVALYVLAAAERLPFADQSFDLVTIASAIHWFDTRPSPTSVESSRKRGGSSSTICGSAPRWLMPPSSVSG